MFSFIKKLDGRSRTLLYACFFAFFCNGALTLTMGSAIPDLKATYGLNDTISGLFLSAHSAGNLVAGFVSGLVPLYLGPAQVHHAALGAGVRGLFDDDPLGQSRLAVYGVYFDGLWPGQRVQL